MVAGSARERSFVDGGGKDREMKWITYVTLVCFQALVCALSSSGEETVTTKEGRRVVLNSDGTWIYATNAVSATPVSAVDTVRAYLSVNSWRERLPLVLNPEKVKPLIEAYYGGQAWGGPKFEVLTRTEPTPTQTGRVKVEADLDGRIVVYVLKKTANGFRIDWEASVGSNAISPEELRATRPTSPVRLRVSASLGDYYNFEFRNSRDVAWCIDMSDGEGKSIGHGYIKKSTPEGEQLFQMLRDGKRHSIVVEIQYVPNGESARVFIISRLVNADGWWFEDTEEPVQPGLRH